MSYRFFHRVIAAFLAIADRFRCDKLSARFSTLQATFPADFGKVLADWRACFGFFGGKPQISAALSIGSLGSFLERIMHPVLPHER